MVFPDMAEDMVEDVAEGKGSRVGEGEGEVMVKDGVRAGTTHLVEASHPQTRKERKSSIAKMQAHLHWSAVSRS